MEHYLKSYFRERVFPKVQLNFNVVLWITSLLIYLSSIHIASFLQQNPIFPGG